MPKPFTGTIDLDIRDSVPDWEPPYSAGNVGGDVYLDVERHFAAAMARD
jgi:hypothetical protein